MRRMLGLMWAQTMWRTSNPKPKRDGKFVWYLPAFDQCVWVNIGLQHIFLGQKLCALVSTRIAVAMYCREDRPSWPWGNIASSHFPRANFERKSQHNPPTPLRTAGLSCNPRWCSAPQWNIGCCSAHPRLPTLAVAWSPNGLPHAAIWTEPPGSSAVLLVFWQSFVHSPALCTNRVSSKSSPTSWAKSKQLEVERHSPSQTLKVAIFTEAKGCKHQKEKNWMHLVEHPKEETALTPFSTVKWTILGFLEGNLLIRGAFRYQLFLSEKCWNDHLH